MKIKTKKQIGDNYIEISVEDTSISNVLFELGKLNFNGVKFCELCGSDHLTIGSHEAQGFKYFYIRCLKCQATVNFGEKKQGGVVYLKTQPKKENRKGKDDKRLYYDWNKFEKGQ